MLARILTYGTIAGLGVGIPLSAIALLWKDQPPAWGMAVGYTLMLVALTAVFAGVKKHRDEALGGVIRFWPAFAVGLAISTVAALFYVLAWEVTLAMTGADFIGAYTAQQIGARRAAGASAAELARFAAEMRIMAQRYADPLYRLPLTFTEIMPVGLLVSLVSAALLRNPRLLPARISV